MVSRLTVKGSAPAERKNLSMDAFLDSQGSDGTFQDRSGWTISTEGALAKVSEFQLPYKGAWVVKVVQAAVLLGATAIKIQCTNLATYVNFPHPQSEGFDLETLESTLPRPDLEPGGAVSHLRCALWNLGIKKGRKFRVAFQGDSQTLLCDDGVLKKAPSKPSATFGLTLYYPSSSWRELGLDVRGAQARESHSSIQVALRQKCFTCPVPLTLDGRRVDSLQDCPSHGGPRKQTLALTFSQGELPEFPFSSRSLKRAHHRWGVLDRRVLDKEWEKAEPEPRTSLAMLTAAYLKHEESNELVGGLQSYISWIQDGVVVSKDTIPIHPGSTAVGCFLSAEGLPCDLTTLQLRQSEEQERRRGLAISLLKKMVARLVAEKEQRWKPSQGNAPQLFFTASLGVGIATAWVPPLTVLGLGLGVVSGTVLSVFRAARWREQTNRKAVDESLEKLLSSLEQLP